MKTRRKLRAYICKLAMWRQFSSAQQDGDGGSSPPHPSTLRWRRHTVAAAPAIPRLGHVTLSRHICRLIDVTAPLPWWVSFVPPPRHYLDFFSLLSQLPQSHENVISVTIYFQFVSLKVRRKAWSYVYPYTRADIKFDPGILQLFSSFTTSLFNVNSLKQSPTAFSLFHFIKYNYTERYFSVWLRFPIGHYGLLFYNLNIKWWSVNFPFTFNRKLQSRGVVPKIIRMQLVEQKFKYVFAFVIITTKIWSTSVFLLGHTKGFLRIMRNERHSASLAVENKTN